VNQGFSSSEGVQIALTRFNEVKINPDTIELGPGLTWDQVYDILEPNNVTVIGGRVLGVGVSGLILGGGECLPS
jgi:hypothetical protein